MEPGPEKRLLLWGTEGHPCLPLRGFQSKWVSVTDAAPAGEGASYPLTLAKPVLNDQLLQEASEHAAAEPPGAPPPYTKELDSAGSHLVSLEVACERLYHTCILSLSRP